MAETVYILCAVTSVACAWLLLRGWHASRTPLLFWSSICFVGLALNNVLLVVDLLVLPQSRDLALFRSAIAVLSIGTLIYGLVWDVERRR